MHARIWSAWSAALFATACSVPQDRIGIDAPPEDQFTPVGDYLDHRCGTIDCHGQPTRNLRLWGCWGMRLDPRDTVSCVAPGVRPTTVDEENASYRSLVGLEPTVMSEVVQGHASNPELLTFMRKAEGLESHKGGHLITPGDDQYKCIVSWLTGTAGTDVTACTNAAFMFPIFPPPPMASSAGAPTTP